MRVKGFTLVELLVTISILSILMTIAVISYGNVQKGARDIKRKSDISNIQSALEQYHADQGYYPATVTFSAGSFLKDPGAARTYLSIIPLETKSGHAQYVYSKYPASCVNTVADPTTYCTNYCLYATVENSSNAATSAVCTALIISGTSRYQTQAP